ncbi:MAG: Site-specific integrase [Marmoricola sp.]|nr:Site-specific integrase [Marmoricola sp.]
MAKPTKRDFGEIDRLPSGNYRARYTHEMTRYSATHTFASKGYAQAWIVDERRLIERGEWTSPADRQAKRRREAEAALLNTFAIYAEHYLTTRTLRPTAVRGYRQILNTRLLPTFGRMPLTNIRLADVKAWHAHQPKNTPSQTAAAYRLLRSILNAAEADELIDRAPARLRGASTVKVKRPARPATLDELRTITDRMAERLRLLVVLAAFCGLREGELLELRRGDIDAKAGKVSVSRAVAKDANPTAEGACPECGRVIGPPKTAAGTRTVYLPATFLPMLRAHLLEHAAPGERGLLFPGERKDHMSVRYLLGHYKAARLAAGRDDLTMHHLRHTALTLAGQEGATAAELQHRAGHSSHAAMAIYQHSDEDRDRLLSERLNESVSAAWDWES